MSNFTELKKNFVISTGRTGTRFFGKFLKDIIPDCFTIHEPDTLNKYLPDFIVKVKQYGFYRYFILKLLGKAGSRNLSMKRITGAYTKEKCIREFLIDRKWAGSLKDSYYIESNYQLFGLAEDIAALENTKIILIVRHPFGFIKSVLNRTAYNYFESFFRNFGVGAMYSKIDPLEKLNILGFKRPTPKNVGEDVVGWGKFSRFKKLVWYWNFINNRLYNIHLNDLGNIRLYRFEDIFVDRNEKIIKDFFEFILEDDFKSDMPAKFIEMTKKKKENTAFVNKKVRELTDTEKNYILEKSSRLMNFLHYE